MTYPSHWGPIPITSEEELRKADLPQGVRCGHAFYPYSDLSLFKSTDNTRGTDEANNKFRADEKGEENGRKEKAQDMYNNDGADDNVVKSLAATRRRLIFGWMV